MVGVYCLVVKTLEVNIKFLKVVSSTCNEVLIEWRVYSHGETRGNMYVERAEIFVSLYTALEIYVEILVALCEYA